MGKLEELAKANEKYSNIKKSMDKNFIYNFFSKNYSRLKKYYFKEIEKINSNNFIQD